MCWTGIRHQHSARELWDQAVSTLPGFCSRSSLIKQLVTDPERRLLYALHENNLIQVAALCLLQCEWLSTDVASCQQLCMQLWACCRLQMLQCSGQAFLMVLCLCCLRHHHISCVRCALVAVLLTQCTTMLGGMTESGLPDVQPLHHHWHKHHWYKQGRLPASIHYI